MFLLRQLQVFLVVCCEIGLDLNDLVPHAFILYFNFEKVLHGIVPIELASSWLVKSALSAAHLHLAL